MKKWEDSIKDRLEGYESPLPEGSLAEFRALREGKAALPAKKVAPWIWGLTAAVAAGLAAILFLRQPTLPDKGIHLIQQPMTSVTIVSDFTARPGLMPSPQRIAHAVTPKAVPQVSVRVREVISAHEDEQEEAVEPDAEKEVTTVEPSFNTTLPNVPKEKGTSSVQMMVPAAGVVAGSGLLAAVAASGFRVGIFDDASPSGSLDYAGADHPEYGTGSPYDAFLDKNNDIDGSPEHAFPLKLGLSTRIPVADRLYLSTGLQYALYSSSFTYRLSGEKKQKVHYVGVPVRIDWVLASGRLFDVYVGGGMQGDICVGATMAGEPFTKDTPSLSLLGAGGIQMKVTRHLGLYAEPELSWRIPSEKHVLQTYRSEHPLMFSVAAGLRIDIGK